MLLQRLRFAQVKKEYTLVSGILGADGKWTETMCDGRRHITRSSSREDPPAITPCDCKDFVAGILKSFNLDWPK